ncbi:MAG: NAD(P)/FAD-dependent oxidoreductase [Candidatus Asgardarchaeia archaeon]
MATYTIIGNGIAGFSAALRLRKLYEDAEIKIITNEKYPIYDRRDLPFFISGRVDEDFVFFTDFEFYKENEIDITFSSVIAIDVNENEVILKNGEREGYDKLIIASGLISEKEKKLNVEKIPLIYLKTIDDAKRIKEIISEIDNVTIIGGYQASFTLASELARIGKNVNLVIKENHPTWEYFDGITKQLIEELLEEQNIKFFVNVKIANVNEKKKTIKLKNGRTLSTEMIIVLNRFLPNISFLNKSKIKVNRGIVVDDFLRTNVQNIFAVGDVAETYNPIRNETITQAGWEVAKDQGELVAYNIEKLEQKYPGAIENQSFMIGNHEILIAGLIRGFPKNSEIIEYRNLEERIYKKFIFNNGFIIGAVIISDKKVIDENKLPLIKIITKGVPMEPWKDDVLSDDFSFDEVYTYFEKNIED